MPKYITKLQEIDAIQFIYSKNGAMDLDEFCGDRLVSVKKERYIGSIAKATIETSNMFGGGYAKESIVEGDYIIKDMFGILSICLGYEFFDKYTQVDNRG